MQIQEMLEKIISFINHILWNWILLYVFTIIGLYFAFKIGFTHIRFKGLRRLIKREVSWNGTQKKGISGFQSLCVSLASRVGTGNIAGVAFAISIGGPGAIFWMWIFGIIIGGASSYIESTLSQLYKKRGVSRTGESYFYGGTSYYLNDGLKAKKLAVGFSILMLIYTFILTTVHSHTIGQSFMYLAGAEFKGVTLNFVSIILSLLVMWPLLGGTLRIAKITSWLVPIMSFFYIFIALIVAIINFRYIPGIFGSIISAGLDFKTGVSGGLLGGVILAGMKRAIFSADPGGGIATYCSASAEAKHPVEQGVIQVFGIFIDIVVICSTTAFLVLLAQKKNLNFDLANLKGIEIAQAAMGEHLGSFGSIFLAIAVLFFAYSSILGNYFYGENNIHYLQVSRRTLLIFRCLVVGCVFMGTLMKFSLAWHLADVIIGVLTLINLGSLIFLSKISFKAIKDYEKKLKSNKEVDFNSSDIGISGELEIWH